MINNAHDLKNTPTIRVKSYDNFERIAQDKRRSKPSRVERTAADKEWIDAFCRVADPYNAALVRFMFETAARIDQAISIEPDDLKPAENKVRVKAQKGHPESWIAIRFMSPTNHVCSAITAPVTSPGNWPNGCKTRV